MYWYQLCNQEGTLFWRASDLEAPPFHESLEIKKRVPLAAFDPCASCDHQEMCVGSRWNELSGPTQENVPLSCVHTCPVCCQKQLSLFGAKKEGAQVPTKCPRWSPRFGSSLDCDRCLEEKETLKKNHPTYLARIEVVRDFFSKDPGTREKAISRFVDLSGPGAGIGLTDDLGDTHRVWKVLFEQALLIPPVKKYWDELPVEAQARIPREWFGAVHLAIQRHGPNPEAVLHEFLLTFTETPRLRNGWIEVSPEQRLRLKTLWSDKIRSCFSNPALYEA